MKKLVSILLTTVFIMSLFACLSGLPAYAVDNTPAPKAVSEQIADNNTEKAEQEGVKTEEKASSEKVVKAPKTTATTAEVKNAATSGTCGDNLTWEYDPSTATLTISGTGEMSDYASSSYNGTSVTTAPWREYYNTVKTVVINTGVTSIGKYTFYGCTGLTSVTIGNSVTSIGYAAFYYCKGLTSITIPNSVTSLGSFAFYICTGLKSVTIGNSVTSIDEVAFHGCTSLTSITIPDSVTSIGDSAFSGCTGIESITVDSGNTVYYSAGNCLIETESKTLILGCKNSIIPSDGSVTSIGGSAFGHCSGLTSITIPNSVTSIGGYAFYGCTGLASITIPNRVTSIDEGAFSYCTGLTSVTIGNSVTSIGNCAFYDCNSLTSITIPDSVTSIGDFAFSGCTGLTSITIPNSVTSIGYGAFCQCTGLASITIPNSVKSIGEDAFNGCTNLDTVYYKGTESDWNNINISSYGNECLQDATVYYIESGTCGDNLTWEYDPSTVTLTISGTGEMYDYFDYDMFWTLSPWQRHNDSIERIVLNNGVTSIGEGAFVGCSSLTNITIPDSVTYIGYYAFYFCTGPASITIPNSVTSIGYGAFSVCTSLTSITMSGSVTSIGGYAFEGCTGLTSITIPDSVTSIGEGAFSGCTGLASITIPNSVTSIGNSAFRDCTSLTSITIPNSVTSIGYGAFSGCTELTSITIPNSVTSISYGAFEGCTNLNTVRYKGTESEWNKINIYYGNECLENATVYYIESGTCGDNLTWEYDPSTATLTISGTGDMYGYLDYEIPCTVSPWRKFNDYIKTITLKYGVTSIGEGAFSECRATNIEIPDSVTSIDYYAFYECFGLTSITIPDSVTSIGYSAFEYCDGLTSVTIGNSVTSIGGSAFYNCFGLTSVTIGNSVTSIGDGAFFGCSSLTSITIPNSVTSIGEYEFFGCSRLASITIPNSVSSIGNSAFYDCTNLNAVHYNGTESEWNKISISYGNECLENATVYYDIESGKCGNNLTWEYDPETATLTISGTGDMYDYFDYEEYGSISPWWSYSSEIKTVIINKGTTSIGEGAFWYCTGFTSIEIPDTVTSIGYHAFECCDGLTSITIPNSVTSIGEYVFSGCSRLASITIPSSITSIGECAFYCCTGLTSITIPNSVKSIGRGTFSDCTGLTSITIPNSVKSIGEGAFSGCTGLASITIPNSVTSIGDYAFYYCTNLNAVHYNGTESEWNKINISSGNKCLENATVYYIESGTCGDNLAWEYDPETATLTISGTGDMYDYEDYEDYGPISPWRSYSSEIKTVIINKDVTSIGGSAFWHCSGLTSITIPNSVTSIDYYAFYGCTGLTSITIPDSVTSIDYYAFYGCTGLTSITIPNSVTSIDDGAFSGCTRLTSITIPDSVTSIGNYAFSGCTRLKKVVFCGTEEEWDNIYIEVNNTALTSASRSYHDYIMTVGDKYLKSAADCTHKAVYYKSCSICGMASDTETFEAGEALGHDFSILVISPTSESQGYTEYRCNRCGDYYIDDYTEVTPYTVAFSPEKTYVAAGETITVKVSLYGAMQDKTSLGVKIIASEGLEILSGELNSLLPGFNQTISGYDITRNNAVIMAGDFNGQILTLTVRVKQDADTCQTIKAETTLNPGKVQSYGIANIFVAHEHNYVCEINAEHIKHEANCTQGTIYFKSCSICGMASDTETFESGEPLGHDYEDFITNPTCTEKGYTTHRCLACDESYVDNYTDALGHNYIAEVTDPTCTTGGYTTHICSRCKDSFVDTYTNALGHTFGEWTTTKAATCTEKGAEKRVCSVCNFEETRDTETLGHAFRTSVVHPTSESQGYTEYTCDVCGYNYKDNYTAALPYTVTVSPEKTYVVAGETITVKVSLYGAMQDKTSLGVNIIASEGLEILSGELNSSLPGFSSFLSKVDLAKNKAVILAGDFNGQILTLTVRVKQDADTCQTIKAETTLNPGDVQSYGIANIIVHEHEFVCEINEEKYLKTAADCTHKAIYCKSCSICGMASDTETFEAGEPLGHNYIAEVTDPTCTEQGYTTHICSRCKDGFVDTYKDALGHSYVETVGDKYLKSAADCTHKAVYYKSCSRCGEKSTETFESGEALGHNYSAVVTDPTCTEGGYTTHTCSRCNDSFVDSYTDALGHDWQTEWTNDGANHWHKCSRCDAVNDTAKHAYGSFRIVKNATCTEKGELVHTCTVCGYDESYYTDALGHDIQTVWTENGEGHWHACSRCEEKFEYAGHTFDAWKISFAPTCTEKGEFSRACTVCGFIEKQDIDALGHDWQTAWTNDGANHWHKCTRCDEINECAAHAFGEWTTTKAPTCTEDGTEERVCTVCEHKETNTLAKLGHNYIAEVTDPTCTEQGFTTHTCSRCKDSFVDTNTDALGHTFGEWTTTKEPTCTEDGEEERVCTACGHKETNTLAKLGHNYIAEVTDPTCTEQGYTTHICSRCKDKYINAFVDELGHDWQTAWTNDGVNHWHKCSRCDEINECAAHAFGEWTTTKAPTCTEDGTEERVCTVCEHKETNTLAKLGHNYIAEVTDPTCTAQGFTTHTCSRCKDSFVDTYTDALGHNWETELTHSGNEHWYACTRCDEKKDLAVYQSGNLDGDGEITDQDAVYLLFYTFFPDDYPIDQPCDFNGDGKTDDQDAVYLLFYTFFPEDYPIC